MEKETFANQALDPLVEDRVSSDETWLDEYSEQTVTVQLDSETSSSHASQNFLPETILAGRYRLLGDIGAGGMGKVLQALDLMTQQLCAIKVMHAHLALHEVDLKRFKREASVSLALKHENIVEVKDFGFIDGRKPFIVMEFLDGQSLDDILEQQHRLSPWEFISIFRQLSHGLSYAHESGVVHRDIKPSNIMIVNVDGRRIVKIVDFGIAKRCKKTGEVCPTTIKALQRSQLAPGASEIFDGNE